MANTLLQSFNTFIKILSSIVTNCMLTNYVDLYKTNTKYMYTGKTNINASD